MDKPLTHPAGPTEPDSTIGSTPNRGSHERIHYLFRVCTRTERIHPLKPLLIRHRQGEGA